MQAAKNAGYVRYMKQWRAMFWTQRRRAHRGVTKEGSAPSLLSLRDPDSGVSVHSEELKNMVEKGFRETPPYKMSVPRTTSRNQLVPHPGTRTWEGAQHPTRILTS